MPYSKGESGNPTGRKPGSRNKLTEEVRTYAQRFTTEAIDCLVGIVRDPTAPPQAKVLASRELLDRGHGRAAQSIDIGHKGVTVNLGFIAPPNSEGSRVINALPGGTPATSPVVQVMRQHTPVLIASARNKDTE
jgi:hypothetical protein